MTIDKTFEKILNPSPMRKLKRKFFPSKEVRAFRKVHRRHRKELVKIAKQTYTFDYGWLDELVHTQIKHMHEYFSAGNNVWQTDETRLPIVEQLQHVLDLYEEMDNLGDDITMDYGQMRKRESELYQEIYNYVGCHIQEWWD
jgi:hypothetical protein